MKKLLLFTLFLSAGVAHAQQTGIPASPWNIKELYQTPPMHETGCCHVAGMRSFFYEGITFKAKPTRVFAYYKAPVGTPPKGGWPAVVCAHGGGGTAFPEWVQAWVDRGYAAIAMDLEGHLPIGDFPNREWHEQAGPPRITSFGDIEISDREQWFYHAVADVIRANSLLRSFPEINPEKIGLHGISWGGVITAAVMGLDNRFAFAVPVYGCGFLHESTVSNFERYFKVMTAAQLNAYKAKWDPSLYIPSSTVPSLWYIGSNDGSFSLDIWQRSVSLAKTPPLLCIPVTSEHGHIWNQPEIFAFADMMVKDGKKMMQITNNPIQKNIVAVEIVSETTLSKAVLCYTADAGVWQSRNWIQLPAQFNKNGASAILPADAQAYYFNITDANNLRFSSAVTIIEK
ncbi:acetylxylan esterase [Agriterribacter sp.]|uniref:acetylxylan esterase n=1 Tax=Agriterribacter sp. TaxID=2821509 RepID=UPI002C7ED759|nr:acetylxylan esterase [Agriterribacter sp.]HRO48429.1 acetylxylan esterase [Agriterribacter sp.]HRQ19436.1 acetylxylan esterase [Agriterribacter sp.]